MLRINGAGLEPPSQQTGEHIRARLSQPNLAPAAARPKYSGGLSRWQLFSRPAPSRPQTEGPRTLHFTDRDSSWDRGMGWCVPMPLLGKVGGAPHPRPGRRRNARSKEPHAPPPNHTWRPRPFFRRLATSGGFGAHTKPIHPPPFYLLETQNQPGHGGGDGRQQPAVHVKAAVTALRTWRILKDAYRASARRGRRRAARRGKYDRRVGLRHPMN